MNEPLKNIKIIYDPLWGLINVTDYLTMIDVPQFQALGFKYQLGVTNLLFPAATHTRKQHSLGSFKRTQNLADRWVHRGFINQKEGRLMIAFALWHDIGHGPFSHVVEQVTQELWGRSHDDNGSIIIDQLRGAVEAAGIDFGKLKQMFTHENPLYLSVHDKNLGTEKLDYLTRDAYYTIGEVPGVEYLAYHTYFIDGQVVIDEKAIDSAKTLQDFYVKMYKTVYFRKNSAIAQRLIQKITLRMLKSEPMSEEDFWALTDFGLLGRFETSKDEVVREYYKKFMHRDLPRSAIELCLSQFADFGQREDKAQMVLGISEEEMRALVETPYLAKPSQLETTEEEIEHIANLPERSVLVVPPISIERFSPQDVTIYLPSGETTNLSHYYAEHFHSLAEEGKSYIVLRVCTFPEYREKLSEPKTAEAVKEYLLGLPSVQ